MGDNIGTGVDGFDEDNSGGSGTDPVNGGKGVRLVTGFEGEMNEPNGGSSEMGSGGGP